jgi:hypothetical protein
MFHLITVTSLPEDTAVNVRAEIFPETEGTYANIGDPKH